MSHRILVVDDDDTVCHSLAGYLQGKLGYDVQTAESGEDAIALALKYAFDLCILDAAMPELSGAETYLRLKSIAPEIEAIFFTAAQEFDRSKDFLRFSLPAERVITKPIDDYSSLTRLIVSILGPPRV